MPLSDIMLGAFVSPTLFWAGAGAAAVPILIHLLARRRFKRIRWAAIDFLLQAERRNRRRIRLEEWLLLALRCLAFVLIALFLARPFIEPSGFIGALGGGRSTERIFLLDDSYSMAYVSEGESSFDRAKEAVRKLCDMIRIEAPDDTVTILRMSEPDRPVELGAYLDDARMEDLLARLDALQPTNRAQDVTTVIQAVAELLERSPDIVNAAVYIISDFQVSDWSPRRKRSEDSSETTNLASPLLAWSAGDRALRVTLINVGEDDAHNLAVTRIALPSSPIVAGATANLKVDVANHADAAVPELSAQVTVGPSAPRALRIAGLSRRQVTVVDTTVEFIQAGYAALTVRLPEDALLIDDVRYAAVDVSDAIRLLLVNGEPSADSFLDEVTYLATALRPEGEVYSGNELEIIDETELEEIDLSRFHAVCLANVYRIAEPAIEALERFVRRGGGILMFLGDQVDASLYNATLFREGEGLLPAELTDRVRPTQPVHLVIEDRLHPVLRGLAPEGDPLGLGQIAFSQYYGCKPFESTHATDALIDEDKDSDASSVRAARVLARFSGADEGPAIIERSLGRGRVVLVTTTADKEWHHWPDHPTYLPMLMELVRHVARPGEISGDQWVGAPIELAIDPAVFNAAALVRTPNYPREPEASVSARPADDGRGLVLTWDETERPGFYSFLLTRTDGTQVNRLVAVNVDPIEGDLEMASEQALRRALPGLPLTYVKGTEHLADDVGEARVEMWRPVCCWP